MQRLTIEELGPRYRELFAVLATAGFEFSVDDFRPDQWGDFVVTCRSPRATLRVISDRTQIFVGVALPDGSWRDKEEILEAAGVMRSRHATVDGLWEGYEPQVQAEDLRRHLPLLVGSAGDGGA